MGKECVEMIDEVLVGFELGLGGKRVIEDEVVVGVEGMWVYRGMVVGVRGYELVELGGWLG